MTRQLESKNSLPLELPQDLLSLYRAKVEKLEIAFQSPAIREEPTQQLRNLVEQIVVKDTKAEPHYELTGDLADMIALANDKNVTV